MQREECQYSIHLRGQNITSSSTPFCSVRPSTIIPLGLTWAPRRGSWMAQCACGNRNRNPYLQLYNRTTYRRYLHRNRRQPVVTGATDCWAPHGTQGPRPVIQQFTGQGCLRVRRKNMNCTNPGTFHPCTKIRYERFPAKIANNAL